MPYTPPAGDSVDFDFSVGGYLPPAGDSVDFAFAESALQPPAGNLLLSSSAPTVALTEAHNCEVPSGNLLLSSSSPLYGVGFTFEDPSGNLTLSSSAPTVAWTDHRTIAVPSSDLVLTTSYADEFNPIPNAADLSITASAPTVSITTSASIEVPSGDLLLTTAPPLNIYVLEWPFDTCPGRITVELSTETQSGGRSLTGSRQYVQADAGFWMITLGAVRIRSNDDVLTWRELETALDGRAGRVHVPAYDGKRRPIPPVNATADGDVPAGATTMTISVDTGATIEEGMHWSVEGRLYRIRKILSSPGGPSYDVSFRPPAREAIADGTSLEFDSPVCRCRLATDDGMDIELDLLRYATPDVIFIEDP